MTATVEINFDGIVGPSHNYAGLSVGNIASQHSAGRVSHPRAAALEGLDKMRVALDLGLVQGVLVPPPRPNIAWLAELGIERLRSAPAHLVAAAMSASSMWTANAATVSPSGDTVDGRCHLTVANLATMPHRSHEADFTLRQLRVAFAHPAFAVHRQVPACYGDEGAANHMRFAHDHAGPGVEVFVYGVGGGPFPARQHLEASRAIARLNRVERALFVRQSAEAIAAGAFHNDVVAVGNERVLFAHEQAFDEREAFYRALTNAVPGMTIVEVPASIMSLEDAIKTYLFNAQLVTLPNGDGMALILPVEVQRHPVWQWLEALVGGNGPIRRLAAVDVRESMGNGGGPACLRLRVACDPAHVDPRFLMTQARIDALAGVVRRHWPVEIAPSELANECLLNDIAAALQALVEFLDLPELSG